MKRNLSRRIEIAFPIYDKELKKRVKDIIKIKLNDNVKARIMDEKQTNEYRKIETDKPHRSQDEVYDFLKNINA
jgi:polyphosphate kinase